MANLEKIIFKLFGPGAIIAVLQNEDPKLIGKELADLLEKRADNNFGDNNMQKIKKTLIPWLDQFYVSFRKALDKND